jgi:hypothetical protein
MEGEAAVLGGEGVRQDEAMVPTLRVISISDCLHIVFSVGCAGFLAPLFRHWCQTHRDTARILDNFGTGFQALGRNA